MRVTSFTAGGKERFGIVVGDGVVDAFERLGRRYAGLRDLLTAGDLDALGPLTGCEPDFALDEIGWLPVIPDPAAKFLCVGVNYVPHIREMGREQPAHPVVFVRFANSFVGHRQPLVKPRNSDQYDFEGELAVVIGRRAHRVTRRAALEHVAGYACLNDGSIRDYQWHGPQWTPGKNFHRSGALGPWMTTADELPDPAVMQLETRLNGTVMQAASIGELCFDVPALIEYVTSWAVLEPGDVVATGTPGGVGAGRKPPVWMQPGDRIEVDISGIGTLENIVTAEDAG